MLPGPAVDLSLKRFYVAVIWIAAFVIVISTRYVQPARGRRTDAPSVPFLVGMCTVACASLMGAVLQLSFTVSQATHADTAARQVYLLDDWALRVGLIAQSALLCILYRRIPFAVRILVMLVPAISETMRLVMAVQTRVDPLDPVQVALDVVVVAAELFLGAGGEIGLSRLFMAPVARAAWRIGRLRASSVVDTPSTTIVEEVERLALALDDDSSIATAEKDFVSLWSMARHAARQYRDLVKQPYPSARVEGVGVPPRGALLRCLVTLRRDPVARLLWMRWSRRYLLFALLKLVIEVLNFATPVLLRIIMDDFTASRRFNAAGCYALVTILVVFSVLGAFARAHYTLELQAIALHSRSMLSAGIFRRAATLRRCDCSAGQGTSVGDITTRMTVDVARLTDQIPCFNDLWALPVQALVTLYLLYVQVSFAFVAGLVIAIALIPINIRLARRIRVVSSKLMAQNDETVLRISEVIGTIKSVKMCGWAAVASKFLRAPRGPYIAQLRWIKLLDAWCVFFWATTPVFVSLATFAMYVWLGGHLTPGKAIAGISLFNTLITPLNAYPWVINGAMEAYVSLGRLSEFLWALSVDTVAERSTLECRRDDDEDVRDEGVALLPCTTDSSTCDAGEGRAQGRAAPRSHSIISVLDMVVLPLRPPPPPSASAGDATAAHSAPNDFTLKIDSLLVDPGELVVLVGPPGGGKSTLILAMCGECAEYQHSRVPVVRTASSSMAPTVAINRRIYRCGLVTQHAFLLPGTIRDNVTAFGVAHGRFNEARYVSALRAAALDHDIAHMSLGDATPVGESGSGLSGGQMLRITLARAYYADPDIYLLDEPLGSLDARVSEHITSAFIGAELAEGKTIVLSTHRLEYLATLPVARTYLVADGQVTFHGRLTAAVSDVHEVPAVDQPDATDPAIGGDVSSQQTEAVPTDVSEPVEEWRIEHTGRVSWRAAWFYFRLIGIKLWLAVLFFLAGMQALRNASDWYVASWVAQRNGDPNTFLKTLLVLGIFSAFFACGRSFLFALNGLRAAVANYDQLLNSLLRATYGFFTQATPGALINRLSKDVYTVDDNLPFTLNIVLAQLFLLVGTIVVIVSTSSSSAVTFLVMLPSLSVYLVLQGPYRAAMRHVKRIESEARSPVIDALVQLMEGGPVLRVAGASQPVQRRGLQSLDELQRWTWNMNSFSAWFALVLQLIGAVILMSVAFTAVGVRSHSTAAGAVTSGLALAYVGPLSSYLGALLGAYTEFEKSLVSVERLCDLIGLKTESEEAADEEQPLSMSDAAEPVAAPVWPSQGATQFQQVSLRYSKRGPLVLKDVSFTLRGGMRLGVVGRTGAGKSSLIAALLRLRPLSTGAIYVDGKNITSVPHDELRRSIAVLPQDPIVWHGTVRDNLLLGLRDDGIEGNGSEPSDAVLVAVLSHVGLQQLPLDFEVGDMGSSLSAGQRQLLCLARLLLRRPALLLMDEATASLDAQSAETIERVIHSHFQHSTVIDVTHKLAHLSARYDLVLVIDRGMAVEFGAAEDLLVAREGGFLQNLIRPPTAPREDS